MSDQRSEKFSKALALKLASTSAFILFAEMVLIRWLPAHILYLSYFSNIILIGSFFGIGLGVMLGRRRYDLGYLFPPLLLLLAFLLSRLEFGVDLSGSTVLYFQSNLSDLRLGLFETAILVFVASALLMTTISQRLGLLLNQFSSLTAYTWDIVGSILGIGLFTFLSYLRSGPYWWFGIMMACFLLLYFRFNFKYGLALLCAAAVFLPLTDLTEGSVWSPYYRLRVEKLRYKDSQDKGFTIFANQTGHQTMEVLDRLPFIYRVPYEYFKEASYESVLIIGAGAGQDIALALSKGVKEVTAVEIDPVIYELGKELHPLKPYDDPRVRVVINDGRNFLEKSDKRYDLIIYALTDSLTLASSYANTRLESYLFTKEAFEEASRHLSENGLFVLYNYYREPWLIEKLAYLAQTTFGEKPLVYAGDENLAAIAVGPKITDAVKISNHEIGSRSLSIPTDDWPFLYLKKKSFPGLYGQVVAVSFLISVLALYASRGRGDGKGLILNWHFFFLGAAFLLLEAKSVIQFNLLFGATWIVNSLVFFAILLFVLLANLIVKHFDIKKPSLLYALLNLSLLLALAIPPSNLLGLNFWIKYLLISLLTFTPVFLANLIFAYSFKRTSDNSFSFGSNLLGAMFGGFLEYVTMLTGYHLILVVILFLYLLSWGFLRGKFFGRVDD